MDTSKNLDERTMMDAWAYIQAQADAGIPLKPNAYRLAFGDPEFLLRRETRGIRLQLELLKPDLDQAEMGIESTIVVYGSARFSAPEEAQALLQAAQASGDAPAIALAQRHMRNAHFYEQARRFGHIVATHSKTKSPKERMYICTGGGPGIMEAANRGASEASVPTLGLNIALPHEQQANPYVTPELSFKFHYFAMRKMHFMMRGKAMVAFPGGFGTLNELFEVITLVQTKKSVPVPIVLFGKDYWKRLINMDALVEEGAISAEDLNLFHYTDDPQEAWEIIREFYKL
ncbi:TIGR00730 family Rossman fold protein [Candidatus Aalborgicola defluviihabitans]|uniref:LOG family protein n=1 Tax=Candidatus Aalborgicola defluviihabitans TaxID=3386187 RepID=UPI001DE7EF18|nr:TIGR00730 family Rossman fold protein [Burkholderiales bacterium]